MKKPTPFGKYFLLERINVGGMAEVFRAKAFGVEGFERLVAVKRILPNIAEDKDFIRMFIEEAKLSVQLNHANIAQIFDLGVVDGAYYIALEHVHGRDLRGIFDRCRQLGDAMPVAQACFVVMKLCEGLDYAHNKRDQSGRELSLVHRDVSPQNVLVSFEGEVKIIDFGIAKAAGKGSKTQAGILKGKFGYMSPEQVRGLPVDRRSDVFSCGIVLYELLTGERLFVGESDFSTLEKVRNVEILPPSTYNRKIPDELERIVLKALAKDVEDRYQNSIDLHDELQAFVYTAGEFYSRKDLAGWMKKTFGKEIDEETAKLESYRQLKPPPAEAPAVPRTATQQRPTTPPPVRRATGAVQAIGPSTPKPPPPPRMSQQVAVVSPPPLSKPAPSAMSAKPGKPRSRRDDSGDLSWDDDELETQIYDNPEDDPKHKPIGARTSKQLPLQAPQPHASHSQAMAASGSGDHPASASGPDLSSLVSTAKGWEAAPNPNLGNPASTLNGIGAANGAHPGRIATGSNQVVTPEPPPPPGHSQQLRAEPSGAHAAFRPEPSGAHAGPFRPEHSGSYRPEPSAPHGMSAVTGMPGFDSGPLPAQGPGGSMHGPLHGPGGPMQAPAMSAPMAVPAMTARPAQEMFDPMASFGHGVAHRRPSAKKGILMIAVGGAAVAAIAVAAVIMITGDKQQPAPAPSDRTTPAVAAPQPATEQPPAAPLDQHTGFDLYVTPSGVSQWKLDGDARTDRLPSRIRGISAGSHTVQIDAPPGYLGQTQQVEVIAGKADRVDIRLQPLEGVYGVFESAPAGATVSLIVDGKRQLLGPSPQRVPLDPRQQYKVLFEKPGYVSVNRPIAFTAVLEEKTSVTLERTGAVASADPEPEAKAPPTPPPPPKQETKTAPTPPKQETKTALAPPKQEPKTEPKTTPKIEPKTEPKITKADPPKADPPKADPPKGGTGTLALGSKPSCEIYVDGASTGQYTPQPQLKLPAGKRRITLVNNEYGIKESFVVEISADKPAKAIKDYSDRMSK